MSAVREARRLPRQPGPAGWNRLLAPPPPPRVLEDARRADLAIIGAGFAGLSAAWRASQIDPGLDIVLLEAGRVGDGPAGRNTGFMIDLPHDLSSQSYAGQGADADRLQTWANRRAIRFAQEAARACGLGRDIVDPVGKTNAAATPAGDARNRAYAAHLAAMNEPHRLLDAEAMAALTGTRYYSSGVYTPGTVMLQPAAYVRGLARGLERAVDLHEDSPVIRMARDGAEWTLTTPQGRVSAPCVILATNGHAESFGYFRRRLLHVFTYASMTEPFAPERLGGDRRWGLTPADPMGTTVRRIDGAEGSRIVVRSHFTCNQGMEVGEAAIARAGRLHDRKFAARFGMLSGLAMAWRWAGHLCLSWNGVPAHGEIEPGLFAAVCQNGLGTARGTLAGISAAELALGRESDTTRAMLAHAPPRRLPPEPLVSLGANATMAWKEWRAGRE